MRVSLSERRDVLEAMLTYHWRSAQLGAEVETIAAHTFRRTANGRGSSYGVARTRACLKAEMMEVPRRVARRRSWGTPYQYYLTEEGIEWLKSKQ